ncbi:tyrosine-type recombinase/integrase [Amycolatopsis pigmentata]|uniref:Tyrosine-type recombinase/integrase n=1 Tax=Amycolatopsis pigmentata TaxID=450801 RepID=A0ABW5FZC0_9PSEU
MQRRHTGAGSPSFTDGGWHGHKEPRKRRQGMWHDWDVWSAGQRDRSRVHDLRHTRATLLLMDGATIREVTDQLGHASITTTANIYGHVLDEAKRKMAGRMSRLADQD